MTPSTPRLPNAPAAFEAVEPRLLFTAAPGAPDPAFGAAGLVMTDFAGRSDAAAAVTVLADGRILLAGTASVSAHGGTDFLVARYLPSGALDTSFGVGGFATIDFGSAFDHALALTVQPDGKIVVAGDSLSSGTFGNYDFAVARLTANGALDGGFGTGGKLVTDLAGDYDQATAVALDPAGRIVVAGRATVGGQSAFAVARYTPAGLLDGTFDTDGKLTTIFSIGSADANALAIDPAGRILLAGLVVDDTRAGNADFALARYLPSGALDPSFGAGGIVTTDLGRNDEHAQALALDAAGRIVVAGYSADFVGPASDFAVIRYTPAGALDAAFGTAGIALVDFANGADQAFALALQADGAITVAGGTATAMETRFALARLTPAGALDTTFGAAGRVVTDIGEYDDVASAIAIDAQGRLIVAGTTYNEATGQDLALAVYAGTAPAPAPEPDPLPPPVVPTIPPPPVATLTGPATAARAQSRALAGAVTNPAAGETYTVEWAFGDGATAPARSTAAPGALAPDHAYAAAGTYTVRMTVRDTHGGVSVATHTILVKAIDLQPDPADPARTALVVGGTAGHDVITFDTRRGGVVAVLVNGRPQGTFTPTGRLIAFGGAGNDVLQTTNKTTLPVLFDGGDGNDLLAGGSANDTLLGGNGHDLLIGRNGNDRLDGGAGDDVLMGKSGDDQLIAGPGRNLLLGGRGDDDLVFDFTTDKAIDKLCRVFGAVWRR